ncbi:protein of unknown function [Burkholderia multivorans]
MSLNAMWRPVAQDWTFPNAQPAAGGKQAYFFARTPFVEAERDCGGQLNRVACRCRELAGRAIAPNRCRRAIRS